MERKMGFIEGVFANNFEYVLEGFSGLGDVFYDIMQSEKSRWFVPCRLLARDEKISLYYMPDEWIPLSVWTASAKEEAKQRMAEQIRRIAGEIRRDALISLRYVDLRKHKIFVHPTTEEIRFTFIPCDHLRSEISDSELENFLTEIVGKKTDISEKKTDTSEKRTEPEIITRQYSEFRPASEPKFEIFERSEKAEEKDEGKAGGGFSAEAFLVRDRQEQEFSGLSEDQEEYFEILEEPVHEDEAEEVRTEVQDMHSVLRLISEEYAINILLDKEKMYIGRNAELSDAVIKVSGAIGRRHCLIIRKENGYFISDEQSANGTFVNGKRLREGEQCRILSGDRIRLANINLILT